MPPPPPLYSIDYGEKACHEYTGTFFDPPWGRFWFWGIATNLNLSFACQHDTELKAGPGRFQPCLEEKISIIDSSWMANGLIYLYPAAGNF